MQVKTVVDGQREVDGGILWGAAGMREHLTAWLK